MKIKAIDSIIEWDAERGRMAVLNPGDTDEVGDTLGATLIEDGRATADDGSDALDHDDDGEAGGSKAGTESTSALGAARKRYRELFGKGPGPKWTVEEIDAKIAEKTAVAEEQAPE